MGKVSSSTNSAVSIGRYAAHPANARNGTVYYNTTDNRFYKRENNAWVLDLSPQDLSTYYTKTEIDNLLAGKANTVHTHTQDQVVGLVTALASKDLVVYHGTTTRANNKTVIYTNSATTDANGQVVFQLTTNGTSTGVAIMDSFNSVSSIAYDGSNNPVQAPHSFAFGWSNSNRTLTLKVTRGVSQSILLGGTINTAQFVGAGVTVQVTVVGTKV